jgi:hypothetical protein
MTTKYFSMFTGVAQGMVTGIRGLCNGLGPALYGFIFFLFHVDLNPHGSEKDIDKENITLPLLQKIHQVSEIHWVAGDPSDFVMLTEA